MMKSKTSKSWLRFCAGLILFALMFLFFASGVSPPGIFGEVLRHNQENNIDASPLFYTEVENMSESEDGIRRLRFDARLNDCSEDSGLILDSLVNNIGVD